MKTLLEKGFVLPSGEINKTKINLVSGAITQPFAEMIWVTMDGDMDAINRHPQKVEIIRNDTGDVIYTSGAIPVGSKIEAAKLDVDLDAGTYECTALFHSLDNSGKIIGSAGAIITITIKN